MSDELHEVRLLLTTANHDELRRLRRACCGRAPSDVVAMALTSLAEDLAVPSWLLGVRRRIAAGEPVGEVMADHGWRRE